MTDAKKTVMPAYVVDKAEGASRLADLQKNLRAEREEAALKALPTPCYVVDEAKLLNNLRLLQHVQRASGAHILLAQKCFSMFRLYPLMGEYLAGTTASGIYEARLGHEEMGKENHVFAPAFKEQDMQELVQICDHIIFNSFAQFEKHKAVCAQAGVSVGIRVNPECSTQEGEHAIYDPCAPGSRMGTTRAQWEAAVKMHPDLTGLLDGIHFHTLCEQDSSDLETTLAAVKVKFGDLISKVKWLNLGGGHHITRPGYDIARLEKCIEAAKEEWKVDIYLEPGEAWALNAGFFLTTVLDVLQNGDTRLAILDGSAACHMPDVLEMPYRPPLLGAGEPGEHAVTVRLGGPTCLSGDVIGDYSFQKPLAYGDLLMFGDMAIYTTCKNNTFNGMPLPDIWLRHGDKTMERLTDFGYEDFKGRLGHRR